MDTADALRRTIVSLIHEGVNVDHLKEPNKRRQNVDHHDSDEDNVEEETTETMIEEIVNKFLKEQESQEETSLTIEVVENFEQNPGADTKLSKHMMLAKLQVKQPSTPEKPEVTIKALRTKKDHSGKDDKTPP